MDYIYIALIIEALILFLNFVVLKTVLKIMNRINVGTMTVVCQEEPESLFLEDEKDEETEEETGDDEDKTIYVLKGYDVCDEILGFADAVHELRTGSEISNTTDVELNSDTEQEDLDELEKELRELLDHGPKKFISEE